MTLEELRRQLSKHPQWALATSKIWKEGSRKAVAAVTKKAVQLLHPGVKCSVRLGRGTAHSWVTVCIDEAANANLSRVEKTLVDLGIGYATYFTDFGINDGYEPCLSVRHTSNGIDYV